MRIRFNANERYPDWDWEETEEPPTGSSYVHEVPAATVERWHRIADEYEQMQREISAMVEIGER